MRTDTVPSAAYVVRFGTTLHIIIWVGCLNALRCSCLWGASSVAPLSAKRFDWVLFFLGGATQDTNEGIPSRSSRSWQLQTYPHPRETPLQATTFFRCQPIKIRTLCKLRPIIPQLPENTRMISAMLSIPHPNLLECGAGGSYPLPDRRVLLARYVLEAPPDSGVVLHLCLHLKVQQRATKYTQRCGHQRRKRAGWWNARAHRAGLPFSQPDEHERNTSSESLASVEGVETRVKLSRPLGVEWIERRREVEGILPHVVTRRIRR